MRFIVSSYLSISSFLLIFFTICESVPIGLIDVIKQEQKLDETDYLKIVEDLKNEKNDNKMTIIGWFKIEKMKARNDLIQIKTIENEKNHQNLKTNNLFKMSYLTENHNFILEISWMFSNKETRKINEKVVIPENEWFFFSYSFNYEIQKHSINIIRFNKDKVVNEFNFGSDFKNFEIGPKFQLDIGCFPKELESLKLEDRNCVSGHIQKLSYIMDYFEKGDKMYFFNIGGSKVIEFLFDYYKSNEPKKIIESIDPSKTKMILEGKNFYNEKNGLITSKGENYFNIDLPLNFNNKNELINIIAFEFKFEYKEFLPTRFNLFSLDDVKGKSILNGYLDLEGFSRNFFIELPAYKIHFKTEYIFQNDRINYFKIALIQEIENFYFIFNSNNHFAISQKFKNIVDLENTKLNLLKEQNFFSGNLNFYSFKISYDIKGIIFKQSNLDYTNFDKYFPKCELFNDIENTKIGCVLCKDDFLLNNQNQECVNYCDKGKKNIAQQCFKCEKEDCAELNQNYFYFKREGFSVFSIKLIKDIFNLKNHLKDLFWVSFYKFPSNVDIKYTIKEDDNNGVISYYFEFPENIDISSGQISFSLKPDVVLIDENKNTIQNQVFEFKVDENNFAISPLTKFKNKIIKNLDKKISKNEEEEEQKEREILIAKFYEQAKQLERSLIEKPIQINFFQILAYFASVVTILLYFVAFLGILINTENLDDDTFYTFFLQKAIQSFLIAKLFAFWIFYTASFNNSLDSFLNIYYKYTIFAHLYKLNDHNIIDKMKVTIWDQMGFIIIFHIILIAFYLSLKIIYLITRKISSNYQFISYPTKKRMWVIKLKKISKNILFHLEFKFLITVILIFSIEYIFCLVHQLRLNPSIFESIISIIIILIIVFLIAFITIFPLKKVTNLWNTENLEKFGFSYIGIELRGVSKIFQGIQYIYCASFSFVILTFNDRTGAISFNFILTVFFGCFIIIKKPSNHNYWKKEQIFVACLLMISKCILLIILFNGRGNFMNKDIENKIGGVLCIFIFFILLWNLIVLIHKVVECIYKLKNLKENMVPSKSSDYSLSPKNSNVFKKNENIFSAQLKQKRSSENQKINGFREDDNQLLFSNSNKKDMIKNSKKSTPTSNSDIKNNKNRSNSKSKIFVKSLSSLFEEDSGTKTLNRMYEIKEENSKFLELDKRGSISKQIHSKRSINDNEIFNEKLDIENEDFFGDKKSFFNCNTTIKRSMGKLRDLMDIEDNFISELNSETSSLRREFEENKRTEIIKDISATSGFIESSDQTIEDEEDKKNKTTPISLFSNTNNGDFYHFEKF